MRFLHVKVWCIHSFEEKMIEISLIPLANPTTRMNKYPSKKGTSPFWMHMVSFFGKGCKPSRVPQTKNRLEIKNVRNNFHSKRWFLHSEWRTEKSPLRTENSPFRGISPFWMEKTLRKTLIYRFLKKERFETLLKKFEWRNLHSKWRFPHSEWENALEKKRETNFKKRFETLLKKIEWRNLHSEWRSLHSEWRKCSGKKRDTFQKKGSKRF